MRKRMMKTATFLCGVLTVASMGFSQAEPPATTAPDQAPPKIVFLSVVSAARGHQASVTVQVAPGAECSIVCVTPSGKISTAKGLGDEAADSNGKVTWTWTVGQAAKTGTATVVVTCGGDQASAEMQFLP
jgi:hypothetical protein